MSRDNSLLTILNCFMRGQHAEALAACNTLIAEAPKPELYYNRPCVIWRSAKGSGFD